MTRPTAVTLTLVGLLHWYLGLRLIRDVGLSAPWSTVGWCFLGLMFAARSPRATT